METLTQIFVGGGGEGYVTPQNLLLGYGNRHGLIAGATGTGKTITLQVLAEGFSAAGVPSGNSSAGGTSVVPSTIGGVWGAAGSAAGATTGGVSGVVVVCARAPVVSVRPMRAARIGFGRVMRVSRLCDENGDWRRLSTARCGCQSRNTPFAPLITRACRQWRGLKMRKGRRTGPSSIFCSLSDWPTSCRER